MRLGSPNFRASCCPAPFLFVLFLILGFLPAAAQQRRSPDELYKDAVNADQHGETEQAIALYRQVIALEPGSVQARSNLGVDLAHNGDYSEAVVQYKEALKLEPQNPTVRLNLALAEYKQADFETAATELSRLHRDQPENHQVFDLLADCYLRLGRNADVVTLLEPVYQTDPQDEAVQYALGTALIREGQIPKGEQIIDRIMKNGNTAEASLLLGEAQFSSGHYKLAADTLHKVIAFNPDLPGCWSLYGQALLESGDTAGAEPAFRHALQHDANDFDANIHLGALLRYNGNQTEAAPYLEKALHLRPQSPEARLQIASLRASQGKLDEAKTVLEQLEKDWPDFLETHLQLATLYARMGLNQQSQRERGIVLKLNEKAREEGPLPQE